VGFRFVGRGIAGSCVLIWIGVVLRFRVFVRVRVFV